MYSVIKWMLVAALIAANGDTTARAQTYNLYMTTGDEGGLPALFDGKFNFTPGGTHSSRRPFFAPAEPD